MYLYIKVHVYRWENSLVVKSRDLVGHVFYWFLINGENTAKSSKKDIKKWKVRVWRVGKNKKYVDFFEKYEKIRLKKWKVRVGSAWKIIYFESKVSYFYFFKKETEKLIKIIVEYDKVSVLYIHFYFDFERF